MGSSLEAKYDLVVIGDGCSAFLFLQALAKYPAFKDLNILLIGAGEQLERSWCFWENEVDAPFSQMLAKSWSDISFHSDSFQTRQKLQDLKYHYIPGSSFFEYFHQEFLPQHPHVKYQVDRVESIEKAGDGIKVKAGNGVYFAGKVYNSAILANTPKIEIWQHFRGWFIETPDPGFDEQEVTLMDFGVPQDHGCSFMYVLPLSPTKALVELTFFSPEPLALSVYEVEIAQYIQAKFGKSYRILDREYGKIPMQQGVFKSIGSQGEINLGTLAGMVKASTGYAFQRMREDSETLAAAYFSGAEAKRVSERGRFAFYDSLLLWIILHEPAACKKIFTRLFQKRKIELILRFMDQKTNIWQEMGIFLRLPIGIFLRALLHRYFLSPFFPTKSIAQAQKQIQHA